jgi:hypothetical protein
MVGRRIGSGDRRLRQRRQALCHQHGHIEHPQADRDREQPSVHLTGNAIKAHHSLSHQGPRSNTSKLFGRYYRICCDATLYVAVGYAKMWRLLLHCMKLPPADPHAARRPGLLSKPPRIALRCRSQPGVRVATEAVMIRRRPGSLRHGSPGSRGMREKRSAGQCRPEPPIG